jgi:alpha-beta hydrolase superfamily lysophospholipase
MAIAGMLAALALAPARALDTPTPVSLRASDGIALSAVWLAPARPAPAVLLLHSLSRTHADLDAVAQSLNSAGFGVLALDLRGHGASGGSIGSGSLQPFALDSQAALAWLKTRPDVTSPRLGIVGLNFGATLAVIAAGSDQSVRSVALISPAIEFRGLRCDQAMRTFAGRSGAAFLAAGALDPYAARSAKQLAEITPGMRELRLVDGTGANGRQLLAAQPDLVSALVDWFQKTLL